MPKEHSEDRSLPNEETSKPKTKEVRFAFGKNWQQYLLNLSERNIVTAEDTLKNMLSVDSLENKRFLDIGSGSGLFSLAARRLGAIVHSFDFDPDSVACTTELKRRYFQDDVKWTVESGSVLNLAYLRSLGDFDIVYSWGVLHHTGEMWKALDHVSKLVPINGNLFIAIYNDQALGSKRWMRVKRMYHALPKGTKGLVLAPAFVRLWGLTMVRDFFKGNPLKSYNEYWKTRGMSPWRDVIDWVGGMPFEVAKPEEIFEFYKQEGFILQKLKTCGGGHGCNEFVFKRTSEPLP